MRHPLRVLLDQLRSTPLHPQWLLRGRQGTRRALRSLRGERVLDVGCSDQWARESLPPGCTYVGLDHPAVLAGAYGARPAVYGDAMRLPLQDGAMHAVLLLEVLEHLPRPDDALAEMHRVLAPGGVLVLSMPFLYPIHDAPCDFQRWTEHGLRHALERAGFRDIEIAGNLCAIETAGLLACLAVTGSAMAALRRGGLQLVVLPFVAASVPVVNLLAWSAARLLPRWSGMTAGYDVRAMRA